MAVKLRSRDTTALALKAQEALKKSRVEDATDADREEAKEAMWNAWKAAEGFTQIWVNRVTTGVSAEVIRDLWQELWITFDRAITLYNPTYGFAFVTYWGHVIRNTANDVKRSYLRTIHVPDYMEKANPDRGTPYTQACADRAKNGWVSSNAIFGVPANPYDHDQFLDDEKLRQELCARIETLPDRLQVIIHGRFGINGTKTRTLEQIGAELGITKERTRQLEMQAIELIQLAEVPDPQRIPMSIEDVILSTSQVANILSISIVAAGKKIDNGTIPGWRLPTCNNPGRRQRRVPGKALAVYLAEMHDYLPFLKNGSVVPANVTRAELAMVLAEVDRLSCEQEIAV